MAVTTRNRTSTCVKHEDECPSTLRARLRSDPPPQCSPSKPAPYENLYQKVQASLGNYGDNPKRGKMTVQEPESNDPATQLRESYARMGLAIHESATENLEKAHADVQAEIKHFAEESSKTLAQSRDLYANIEYPLSKTLCDSDDHPRASLEVHLNRLKQDIAAAREQVVRLSAEWEECCRTEEEAWDEFKNGLEHRGRGATGMDEETKVAAEEFKKEARAIVEANCQLLDEIDQPALDLAGHLTGLALGAHGDVDVLSAVVDLRNGADEVLIHASGERLEQTTLSISLHDLRDGVLSLSNLILVTKTLTDQLQTAATGNTIKDQLVVKRSSDDLLLAVLSLPHNEKVTGASLSTLALRSVQPENLVESTGSRIYCGEQRGAVVGAHLGVTETADPGAHHVVWGCVQAHSAGGSVHAWHESHNDVQESFLGSRNTKLGSSSNDGGADVQEASCAVGGEPLGSVNGEERNHELLDLGGLKARKRNTGGRHAKTSGVAVRTEDSQLSIVAAVHLEALEALGSVVKNGSGGHEAQGAVGLEFRSGPAGGLLPGGEDHVVGGDGLVAGVGVCFIGDGARVLGVGVCEL
ncbi:hypothetical protein HG531_000036 [Fusarium graminearum]|nr:hypothetical protein HG531_000036 [Fusarium graminearum]